MNSLRGIGVLALAIFTCTLSAQLVDGYGVSLGASYTNQDWHYKWFPMANTGEQYKWGMAAALFAEKNLATPLDLRVAVGYIQKGFKSDLHLTGPSGVPWGTTNDNLVLHDLNLDVALKFKPFDAVVAPYLLAGVRGDYRLGYPDVTVVEPGTGIEYGVWKNTVDQFNEANLGGLFGVGIEFNGVVFVEGAYNPSFTKTFTDPGLDVRDNCWEFRAGVNLNKVFGKAAP